MTEGRATVRVRVLATLIAFMFASLVTRLWFLQVLASEKYRSEVGNNIVRTVEMPAPRGKILDDRGNVLVDNRTSLFITINREEAGSRLEQVLYELSKVLGQSPRELAKTLREAGRRYYSYQPVPVATDVPRRVVFWIAEHPDLFPGVQWPEIPVRTYPYGTLAAHVLGYLGQISPDQLKDPSFAGYEPGDIVGQSGVERQYEHWLVGTKGIVKYRVNRFGDNMGQIGMQPPKPGDDLVLTLDSGIQKVAEESLRQGIDFAHGIAETDGYLKATGGAVVVIDPTTGDIKALASYPTYDPEVFVNGSSDARTRLIGAPRNPLLDRAIQGLYPPGSTYKPFVALSALKRGVASLSSTYPCPGSWAVPQDPLHEHFDNWTTASLGYMSLAGALVESCDTIFYPFGFEYWKDWYNTRNDRQPSLPLQHDLRSLGFGSPTDVDIPFEKPGLVPDPMWKAKAHHDMPTVYPQGDTYPADFINMSIGQGETLVTPLQIADAYSAIANDGIECWPHVADRIESPTGKVVRRIRPHCKRRLPFAQTAIRYVRTALSGVPTHGTAATAFAGFPFSQVSVAGKTGTAQVYGQQDYSWFAAMTQGEGKRYVIVAMVEQGGHGSTTAAPIVRHVIEQIYGLTPSSLTNGGTSD